MAEFWGIVLKGGQSKKIEIPEDHVVAIANAALVGKNGDTAKIYATVTSKFLLATLVAGRTDQVSLDVTLFAASDASISVEGAGEVHLVGSMSFYGDEGDEGDSDDDEEDAAFGALNGPAGKKLINDEADEDDGEDDDEDDGEDDGEEGDDDDDDDDDDETAKLAAELDKQAAATKQAKPANANAAAKTPTAKTGQKPGTQTPKAAAATTPATTPAANKRPASAGAAGASAKKAKPAAAASATPKAAGSAKPSPAAGLPSPVACDVCKKNVPNVQALEQHKKAKHSK